MTRSVYLVGGAGTGKSTLMGRLMAEIALDVQGLGELAVAFNKRGSAVKLRGHAFRTAEGRAGMYLGVLRDQFPGTDGLDRVSSIAGEVWLEEGDLPDIVVGEGATLSTTRFMTGLHQHTEMLGVHLHATLAEKERRFVRRGSSQDPKFVLQSTTRSANVAEAMRKRGTPVIDVNTEDPDAVDLALDLVLIHLGKIV